MTRTLPDDPGYHGDPRRGASLGRIDRAPATKSPVPLKFSLKRLRLNSGGYDQGGAYWGQGQPLYWAATDDGATEMFFRADSRALAKAEVRSRYPGSRFY